MPVFSAVVLTTAEFLDGDFASEYIAVETPQSGAQLVRIRTPAHMPDVDLKPGQAYEPSAQQVIDSYQIPPAPAED